MVKYHYRIEKYLRGEPMNKVTIIFSFSGLLVSGAGFSTQNYSCVSPSTKEVREVNIIEEVPGQKVPCRVEYVVNDKPEVKFTAKNEEKYCEDGANKIKDNLEKGGAFTCEVKQTQ